MSSPPPVHDESREAPPIDPQPAEAQPAEAQPADEQQVEQPEGAQHDDDLPELEQPDDNIQVPEQPGGNVQEPEQPGGNVQEPEQPGGDIQEIAQPMNEEPEEQLQFNEIGNVACLQNILRNYYDDDHFTIENLRIVKACHESNNFVSRALRFNIAGFTRVDGQSEDFVNSYIVKVRRDNEEYNRLMNVDVAFDNEILTYQKIIPLLNKRLKEKIKCPEFIYGNDETVLMDDMKIKGYVSGSKIFDMPDARVKSVIREIAKIHAGSLIAEYKDSRDFDDAKSQIRERLYRFDQYGRMLELKQKATIEFVKGVLENEQQRLQLDPNDFNTIRDTLVNLIPNCWLEGHRIVSRMTNIRVINHCDIWINNLLFKNDDCVLLDWQNIRYGSPAIDLTYFFHIGLKPIYVNDNYDSLLQYYLDRLKEFLDNQVPDSIDDHLTLDWIKAEMDECKTFGYLMAIWIIPVLYVSEEDFDRIALRGGFENISIEERITHFFKPNERDRLIQTTRLYALNRF